MVKKRQRKKNKQINLFKGILIFAIVSFFTWMFMTGLLDILNIDTSPWVKTSIGLIGLFIVGYIGWKKF